ncbi:histone acetyltransferase of the CBP family [Trifolium repens]|nr:histone acetyltransferase of the CBP family [Trifolium repens]
MVGSRVLQGESLEEFNEGVGYILNQWFALQIAIDYEMGDNNFHPKVEKLIADVRSWFAQSKEPYHIGELAILIEEGMDAAFDPMIKDGSVEDDLREYYLVDFVVYSKLRLYSNLLDQCAVKKVVAAKIMGIHADCKLQNYENIKLLREQQGEMKRGEMNDLLLHASECRVGAGARCRFPNCFKVKGLFRHGMRCRTRASGGCDLCKKMWFLLQLHACACNKAECNVPRCSDIKEHLRRLQQPNRNEEA